MNIFPESAVLGEDLVEKTFSFQGTPLLHIEIRTPRIKTAKKRSIQRRFDFFYKRFSRSYLRYCQKTLFDMASNEFQLSRKLDLCFTPFEASLNFTVTFWDGKLLSLYFDRVENGGCGCRSHLRYGDTWNLETGIFAEPSEFFPGHGSLKRRVLELAEKALLGNKLEPGEMKKLLNYFSVRRYYLTEKGVVFFFQPAGPNSNPVVLLIPRPLSEPSLP
jgi:hypothetical protein